LQSLSYMPEEIGILRWIQDLCGTTGMLTGEKKSSLKCPLSEACQAKASLCNIMK
jgi:hypothetical protein